MKKLLLSFMLISSIFTASLLAAQDDTDWGEIGEQGITALKETGKFFRDLGKGIGSKAKEIGQKGVDDFTDSSSYVGNWKFQNGNNVTEILINEDNTLQITQKQKADTYYWKGTYSLAIRLFTFTIEEEGTNAWFVTNTKSTQSPKKWHITATAQEDENLMKFSCYDIPTDEDGNDFSNGQIFTRF